MRGGFKIWAIILGVLLAPLIIWLTLWGWLLWNDNVLESKLAEAIPWPVACTTRGCITTAVWQRNYEANKLFAKTLDEEAPHVTDALTTAIRHHLVEKAFVRSPISTEDATRYREEILQNSDEGLVLETTGFTLKEYDETVLVPLLQQEVLRQQARVESFDELYAGLANDRKVLVLPFKLQWDKDKAQVVPK